MTDQNILKEEGRRLSKVKEIRRLTWKKMAQEIGVNEATLRQISSGRMRLSSNMCRNFDMRYNAN